MQGGGRAFPGSLLPTLMYESRIGLGCSPAVKQNALSAGLSRSSVCECVCVWHSQCGRAAQPWGGGWQSPPGSANAGCQRCSPAGSLWVVPALPLLAMLDSTRRAIVSWCGPGDQSGLGFVTKLIHKILLLLKELVIWNLGLGELVCGWKYTFFVLVVDTAWSLMLRH